MITEASLLTRQQLERELRSLKSNGQLSAQSDDLAQIFGARVFFGPVVVEAREFAKRHECELLFAPLGTAQPVFRKR